MPNSNTMFETDADVDTLGNRLLRAREAGGLSLTDCARNLGVKKSTIESWESDRSEPRAHHLVRVSGMLNVSPSWILGGVGESPSDSSISDEIKLIRGQISQLKAMRDQTSQIIEGVENALERLIAKDDS